MSPVDPTLRDAVRKSIMDDYGQHALISANKMPRPRRLPTRSLALDYVTGGGWPFRNMSRLWGGPSAAKSLSILNALWCAQNFGELRYQRLKFLSEMSVATGDIKLAKQLINQAKRERDQYAEGLTCMLVNAEGVVDTVYWERIGLDLKRIELVLPPQAKRIEVVGDIVQKALAAFNLVCVDSTSSTISLDELGHKEGIMGDSAARAMHRAAKWGVNLAWWADRMNDDNVLLYTSQIRAKIGMNVKQKVAQEMAPGGNQLEHESSCTVHFMRAGALRRKDGKLMPMGDDSKAADTGAFGRTQAAGSEIVARCEKNRFGKSHRTALLHHDRNAAQFDFPHEYEKLAKYFRVVKPTSAQSSWYELPDGSKTQSLRSTIEENPELARRIEEVTLRCAEDPEYEDTLLRSVGGPGEDLAEVA